MDGAVVKPRVIRTMNNKSGGKNEKRGRCRYTVADIQRISQEADLPARERCLSGVSSSSLFLSRIDQSLASI